MEDEFNSLAMKALSGESTEEESLRLKELIEGNPDLKQEFEAMQKELPAAMDLFSMIPDPDAQKVEMPEYVRTMLQGEVQRTFSDKHQLEHEKQKKKERSALGFLWKFALAGGLCVCALTISGVLDFGPKSSQPGDKEQIADASLDPVINLAVLDFIGPLRGGYDTTAKVLGKVWPGVEPQEFDETLKSKEWLSQWDTDSKAPQVKVLYNLNEGVFEVIGIHKGETKRKSIDQDGSELADVLIEIQALINEWYPGQGAAPASD